MLPLSLTIKIEGKESKMVFLEGGEGRSRSSTGETLEHLKGRIERKRDQCEERASERQKKEN